jgi:hypothetical protein
LPIVTGVAVAAPLRGAIADVLGFDFDFDSEGVGGLD